MELHIDLTSPRAIITSAATLGWNLYQWWGTASDALSALQWVLDHLA